MQFIQELVVYELHRHNRSQSIDTNIEHIHNLGSNKTLPPYLSLQVSVSQHFDVTCELVHLKGAICSSSTSMSHRLYIKYVEILFNKQSLVEAYCSSPTPLPQAQRSSGTAGTLQERKTSATLTITSDDESYTVS